MKRLLVVLLVICSMVLTSCNYFGGNSSSKSGDIVIKWMPQNDGPVDENSPHKARLEKMFNTKFEFIYIDRSKEKELLNVRITSGDIPDVMRRPDTEYRTFIKQNILTEIPIDYIKQKAPKLYEVTKKYGGEKIWDYGLQDGKNFGIPLLNLNGKYHSVPVWRDDWLRKVGIDKLPETVDEAEVALYKFANEDPDGNGAKDTYAMSNFGITEIFCAYGAYPYKMYWTKDSQGKIVLAATLPEMKNALERIAKWYKDGLIDPEFISGENKGKHFANSVLLWNGKIGFSMPGMFYHIAPNFSETDKGSFNYQNFKNVQGANASYVPGKPLVGPTGKSGGERWGEFAGDFLILGKDVGFKSAKMDKILEILEAQVSNFDMFATIQWGEKDVDYKINNGIYESIIESKDRVAKGISVHGIGNLTNNFEFLKKINNPKLYEYAEKYATTNDNYSNLVWGGLPSDDKYKSVIDKKIQENYIAFIIGKRPINQFDDFVNELNQIGLIELTKEANDWYNKMNK